MTQRSSIGLTASKASKRVFVHWTVESIDWPSQSFEETFSYNKVVNAFEFPPLEVLHYLLITLRLGKHTKGEFKLTRRGAELADRRGELLASLIPALVLESDHASYARLDERPFGNWDTWLNVINAEAEHGRYEQALFAAFSLCRHSKSAATQPQKRGLRIKSPHPLDTER